MALGTLKDPSPPSLLELMIEYTLSDLRTVCVVDSNGKVVSLRDDAYLPSVIGDRIVNTLARRGALDEVKLAALCDTHKIQLKKINLSRTALSDESLEKLSHHKLTELDISECEQLSKECLPHLLHFTSLHLLNLHKCKDVLEKYGLPLFDFPLKNLRSLNIGYTDLSGVQLFCLIKQLTNLTVLDVSKVVKNGDLSFLEPVRQRLRSLTLHDCVLVESSLEYICNVRELRHLDISVNNEGYKLPLTTATLHRIIKGLPHLVSLDLSGNDIRNQQNVDNHNQDVDRLRNNDRGEDRQYLSDEEDDIDVLGDNIGVLGDNETSEEEEEEEERENGDGREGGAASHEPGGHVEGHGDEADSAPAQAAADSPMDIDNSHNAAVGADGDEEARGKHRRATRDDKEKERRRKEEEEEEEENEHVESSIEGLKGLRHELQFLGLVGMDECEAEHIPAVKVAGLANEDQILNTIEMYLERRGFLLKGLNAYFDILRVINCQTPLRAVQGIIEAMKRYPSDNQIQISGSASLFHLTRGQYKKQLTKAWKQAVIISLLEAIEGVSESVTLLRNCGLTLFNFVIPDDFQFDFQRVVRTLVKLALTEDREGLLQRVYVHMCNSIVCHVEGSQKLLVGKLGIINCMLKLIKDRLERRTYDEVMETAWSTLWNVTDETAPNCELFLMGDGMQLFLRCKETFKERPELLRNMMGLMGNVAEVQELRPQLIPHVPIFASLLTDRTDGIEVSYNAAGALAHMASDGESAWNTPTRRDTVLAQMSEAIENWRLDEPRNINYRSFEPILRLLNVHHTPQVQLWATWALANLCTVSRDKYCQLLVKEGGLQRLQELVARDHVHQRVAHFANIAINLSKDYA